MSPHLRGRDWTLTRVGVVAQLAAAPLALFTGRSLVVLVACALGLVGMMAWTSLLDDWTGPIAVAASFVGFLDHTAWTFTGGEGSFAKVLFMPELVTVACSVVAVAAWLLSFFLALKMEVSA